MRSETALNIFVFLNPRFICSLFAPRLHPRVGPDGVHIDSASGVDGHAIGAQAWDDRCIHRIGDAERAEKKIAAGAIPELAIFPDIRDSPNICVDLGTAVEALTDQTKIHWQGTAKRA